MIAWAGAGWNQWKWRLNRQIAPGPSLGHQSALLSCHSFGSSHSQTRREAALYICTGGGCCNAGLTRTPLPTQLSSLGWLWCRVWGSLLISDVLTTTFQSGLIIWLVSMVSRPPPTNLLTSHYSPGVWSPQPWTVSILSGYYLLLCSNLMPAWNSG